MFYTGFHLFCTSIPVESSLLKNQIAREKKSLPYNYSCFNQFVTLAQCC